MNECSHTWTPVPLEMGWYTCARCGASGYRKHGRIAAHKAATMAFHANTRKVVAESAWWNDRAQARKVVDRGRSGEDYDGLREDW